MKDYHFNGHDHADVHVINHVYAMIDTPYDLYDALCHCWCPETCAPRLRHEWTKENYTKGQCSITAFLVQDLFGGKVYGIPNGDGTFHCYNVVDDIRFDLASEQFGEHAKDLVYDLKDEQFRDVHFKKEEKYQRYILLKEKLDKYMKNEDH